MSAPCSRPNAIALALVCALALGLAAQARALTALPDTTRYDQSLSFHIDPVVPCTADSVKVTVTDSCGICLRIRSFRTLTDNWLELQLDAMPDFCWTDSCTIAQASATTGPHPAQPSDIMIVRVVVHLPHAATNPPGDSLTFLRSWRFPVTAPCGPTLLEWPVVGRIVIGDSIKTCSLCAPRVCANEPMTVRVTGLLPNACWIDLGLSQPMTFAPIDHPVAILTLREACTSCLTRDPQPFDDSIQLSSFAAGTHRFELVTQVLRCDSSRVDSTTYTTYVSTDSCPPSPPAVGCVWPYLEVSPSKYENVRLCDLVVPPGGSGAVSFSARSTSQPLAGLQGSFTVSPNLRITGLEPEGAASGMHLVTSSAGPYSVHFVLFADQGAPIRPPDLTPLLRVHVQADSRALVNDRGSILGLVSAGSDSTGMSMPVCAVMRPYTPAARICIANPTACDVNGDGRVDVSDLVRMARCWFRPLSCPDSATAVPDCNGDGAIHLDDLMCCARQALGAGPRDSTRAARQVHVSLGEPEVVDGMVRVPLVISGATEMSGALLHVSFPSDRYRALPSPLASRALTPETALSGGWLPLTELGETDVVVGVLRVDDTVPAELTVPLYFALRDGQSPGGEVRVDQGSVTAPDGAGLAVDLTRTASTLPGVDPAAPVTRVELLCGPNPSTGQTHFLVRMPASGDVDLSVFDLAGRRVATMWHGAMTAGQRSFTWDATGTHSGVYFARLSVNGIVRTSRVTLQLAR